MNNHITIVELAQRSGVPGNSVILYLSMFEEFFREHKIVDGIKKIPEDKADLIHAIHDLYVNHKMTKEDIREKVRTQYPWEVPKASADTPELLLGEKIDALTREMDTFNTTGIDRIVQAIERLADVAQSMPGIMTASSEAITTQTATVLDRLLTTRQDDQEDDPELLKIIEASKADLVPPDPAPEDPPEETETLSFEPRGSEEDAGEDIDGYDAMVDRIIDLHQQGLTPEEIKTELKQLRNGYAGED